MTQEHPITPPPALVEQWYDAIDNSSTSWKQELAIQAARWGADQELDQCVEWVNEYESAWLNGYEREGPAAEQMRAARRPKPPSLKEQALKELHHLVERLPEGTLFSDAAILRAIESLPS